MADTTTTERLPYIDPILCFFQRLITGSSSQLSSETSFDKLRLWSEKAELEIESGQMVDAVQSLEHVASRLLATGYSEELFRVGKRIINDFCRNPSQYSEVKEFDDLFRLVIEALIEFGYENDARYFLKFFEKNTETGTARFIGFCNLMTWIEWHLLNFEEAIKWGKKGKNLKQTSLIDTKHDCSHNLALALRDSGFIDEALDYFLAGNSLDSVLDDDNEGIKRSGAFFGNIGRCLMFQGKHQDALKFLKKSAFLVEKDQSAEGIKNQGYAAKWIAESLEKCGYLDESYIFYRKAKNVWDQRAPILSPIINSKLKTLEQSQQIQSVRYLGEKDIIRRCFIWINSM